MIYSNANYPLLFTEVDDAQVRYYQLGSYYYQGGKSIGAALPVLAPKHFKHDWYRGANLGYTIVRREKRQLRIVREREPRLCVVLSSRLGNYGEMGRGCIRILRDRHLQIASVVHAVDRHDPQCQWTDLVAWAQPGDAFYLTWHTSHPAKAVVYFVDDNGGVHEVERNHLYNYCQKRRFEPPFTIDVSSGQNRAKLNLAEWRRI